MEKVKLTAREVRLIRSSLHLAANVALSDNPHPESDERKLISAKLAEFPGDVEIDG